MKKILLSLFLIAFALTRAVADAPLLPANQTIEGGCNILNLGVADGSVIMVPTFTLTTYICSPGYYLPADAEECIVCPNDNYCAGGAFQYNETSAQGITECPNSWYAPAGMSELSSCGRILHIGDNVVYLRSVKKTTPSLNVKIGNDIFYGNMTTSDVIMNSGTERKLKISYDNETYYVYDDTVSITQ